jgi:hypothetical protein
VRDVREVVGGDGHAVSPYPIRSHVRQPKLHESCARLRLRWSETAETANLDTGATWSNRLGTADISHGRARLSWSFIPYTDLRMTHR